MSIEYGVLKKYLDDENVIEVICNSDGAVWVDTYTDGMYFTKDTISAIKRDLFLRIVADSNGKTITPIKPSLSAKVYDYNARLQGEVPPIVTAPIFTIRKPTKNVITLDEYVESNILSQEIANTLKDAFLNHKTIVFSGGTGSGKTSLANAFLDLLSDSSERIYIIEDASELVCKAKNNVSVMVNDIFTYKDAVKASLRHRPDRIIIGEVRDSAALDLLKAWNTGHPGGLATIHANSAKSVDQRLKQLVEESNRACSTELISEAVDFVVHIEKTKKGREITEIYQYVAVIDSVIQAEKIL